MPRKQNEDTFSFKGWIIFKRKIKEGFVYYARPKGKVNKISLHTTDIKQAKVTLENLIQKTEEQFNNYISVGELLDDWRNSIEKRGNEIKRLDYRLKRLHMFFGKIDADEFTRVDGYAYIEEYRKLKNIDATEQTLSRDLTDLSAALNFAFGNRNPHTGELKEPKLHSAPIKIKILAKSGRRERVLTDDEFSRLLDACQEVSKGLHLAVLISSTMAARRQACLDLTKDRVKNGVIDFNNPDLEGRRKGRAINKIPQALLPFIQHAIDNNKSNYICEHNGRSINSNKATHLFDKARRKAGLYEPHLPVIERISFHNLRHHCLTNLARNSVSMFKIAKIAGHSNSTITEQVYSHLDPHMQNEEADLASKMLLKATGLKVVPNKKEAI